MDNLATPVVECCPTVLSTPPSEDRAGVLARACAVLADPVRLRLLGPPAPVAAGGGEWQRFTGVPGPTRDGPRSNDWLAGHPDEHVVELVFPPGGTLFTFDFSQG